MDDCSRVWATRKALAFSSISCCLESLLKSMPRVGRCVLSTRCDRHRDRLTILWTPPCTGQVQSRGMSSCQIPLSVLVLTDTFFPRTNCTCVPTQRSKHFTSISVSRYCIFHGDLYSLRIVFLPYWQD